MIYKRWSLILLSALCLFLVTPQHAQAPHGVTVSWTAPPAGIQPVSGYTVWRATSTSGPFTQIGAVGASTLSYLDPASGLPVSTPEYYQVQATDAEGDVSPFSKTASVTTPGSWGLNAPGGCNATIQ